MQNSTFKKMHRINEAIHQKRPDQRYGVLLQNRIRKDTKDTSTYITNPLDSSATTSEVETASPLLHKFFPDDDTA